MTRDTHRQGEELSKAPAGMVDEELQSATLTLAGDPETVSIEGLGLAAMADNQYRVAVHSEGAAKIDESTKTQAGFDLIGGSASDVVHIWIHGKIASRKR